MYMYIRSVGSVSEWWRNEYRPEPAQAGLGLRACARGCYWCFAATYGSRPPVRCGAVFARRLYDLRQVIRRVRATEKLPLALRAGE